MTRRDLLAGGGALALAGCGRGAEAQPAGRQEIGVNMYDLFMVLLWGGDVRVSPPKLETLGRLGIPFVRFPASGQFAAHWQRLEQDPKSWWATMDSIFAAAEHSGVRLVPSILWAAASLSAHLGEPAKAWGDPASRTRRYARDYTSTFVRRYRGSPAVLMWEFANELNVWADWNGAGHLWPPADPTAPHVNGPEDRISGTDVTSAFADFARTVRQLDPRPIETGSDLPHPAAWHLARGGTAIDTPDQFAANLRAITPAECGVLSVHLYPGKYGGWGHVFPDPRRLLDTVQQAAVGSGREAFVGEFGVSSTPVESAGSAAERRTFAQILDAIRGSGIRYAALWDYDRAKPDPAFNVLPDNARAYQLDAIVEFNRASRDAGSARSPTGRSAVRTSGS